jgi:hypothetical protein
MLFKKNQVMIDKPEKMCYTSKVMRLKGGLCMANQMETRIDVKEDLFDLYLAKHHGGVDVLIAKAEAKMDEADIQAVQKRFNAWLEKTNQ